jgi:DNA-binding transcriptional LysR family regulator
VHESAAQNSFNAASEVDWNDLKYVLALSRHANLPEAAEALQVNRSTVSRRVMALGAQLGAPLFERVGRDLVLTEAGRSVVATAELLAGEVDALGRSVEGVSSSVRGHIRLTAPPLLARLLVPVLSEFQTDYPDASLEVKATNMVQDLELLESDVALRLTNSPPENLVGRVVAHPKVAVYAHRDAPPGFRNAPRHRYAAMHRTAYQGWVGSVLGTPVDCVLNSNSGDLIADMVAADPELVAALPCFVAEQHAHLERISDAREEQVAELWLLYHPRFRNVHRIRVFVHFLAERIADMQALFDGAAAERAA